ncbi:Retrovirus-related Pol polyprotein from transposon opus [Nosema granulosis]|uniref:Retrovirus-related Pol polyprotein from transposon opus n=1 Tax=Nosema granulosis TaxID=83296 RepID=A0A9P6KYH5_9MICR|nr:Retrovirus-related Pol polyprotein from transposon opus [Nosema granulosis]
MDDLEETGKDLEKYNGLVRSASGDIIKIVGRRNKLNIKVFSNTIEFSPLVMKDCKYIILGADVIKTNPSLLMKTMSNIRTVKEELKENSSRRETLIKREFAELFKTEIDDFNLCTTGTHNIRTTTDRPFCQRNGRVPIKQVEIIENEIEKNLRMDIIRPSKRPWCSRIVMAEKSDGNWRMCVDYKALNAITIKDRYTPPRIDEIYDVLSKARIFSILDSTSGYYQIAMEENDEEKTAFSFKGRLYEFNRMPFGLCNAPATFQRSMDVIFRNENRKFVDPYLDDIIVYSKDEEEHKKHLRIVLGRLKAAGVSLNEKKYKFFRGAIKILGNIISEGKIAVDPERIDKINTYTRPTNIKDL